jgi:rubrerythrin
LSLGSITSSAQFLLGENMSVTLKNLESALAGESMAHIKYRYFAKIPAFEEGHEEIAKHFEHTADRKFSMHADTLSC